MDRTTKIAGAAMRGSKVLASPVGAGALGAGAGAISRAAKTPTWLSSITSITNRTSTTVSTLPLTTDVNLKAISICVLTCPVR